MAGWIRSGTATVLLAVAVVSALAEDATAASCSSLRAELASAGGVGGDRAKAERYATAMRRQSKELSTTKRMADRMTCSRVRTSQCRTVLSTISAMEKRLAELDGQRRRALGNRGRSRSSIERDLEQSGCTSSARKTVPPKVTRASRARPDAPLASLPTAASEPRAGSYRTVCVRTCDGYYFPISNAIGRGGFAADTKRCASMCPRAQTRLFVHPLGGSAETMFDRRGKRYAEMSYAFQHTREDYRPSEACSCGRPVAPIRTSTLRGTADVSVPSPIGIAPPAGDAETRRNAALDFGWDKARTLATDERPTDERPVRVVGPVFLPDPTRATTR